jgi:hypothetical protein
VACRTAFKIRAREARQRACERRVAGTDATAPDEGLLWQDLGPRLDEAVAGLPEKYRVPFVLHHLQEMPVAEVARKLNCPQGTVACRLARAKAQLRTRLIRRGLVLSATALGVALTESSSPASVPSLVVIDTVRAATAWARAPLAAGIAPVAALAQGGGKAMLLTQWKVGVVLLLVACAGAVGWRGPRTPPEAPAHAGAPVRPTAVAAPATGDAATPTPREGAPEQAHLPGAGPVSPAPVVLIAALVNGEPILDEDVYAAAFLTLPKGITLTAPEAARQVAAVRRETLDRVVESEVVRQGAGAALRAHSPQALAKLKEVAAKEFEKRWAAPAKKEAGLDDEGFRERLRQLGTSLGILRRQWERDFVAQEYLRSRTAHLPGEAAQRERQRLVGELKRGAVIEYPGGR